MTAASEGFSLTIGDLRQVIPMTFPDATVEEQFASRLKSADHEALSVRISPNDEADVEGHWRSSSVTIDVLLDDDTEGHAMSLHFPSVEEADRFRRRLMAVGLLAGTLAIGSAGAMAIANAPSISTGQAVPGTAPAVTMQAPAGHGFFENADISPVAPAAAGAATPSPGTRGGFTEGADLGAVAPAAAAASEAAGAGTRGGLVEGADIGIAPVAAAETGAASTAASAENKGGLVEGADIDSGAFGIGSSVERSRIGGPVEGADR